MSKPASGEWFVDPEYPEYVQARKARSTRQIAKILTAGANSPEERLANAIIFAASKDLLEALLSLRQYAVIVGSSTDPVHAAVLRIADEAIAKARGDQ